MRPNIASGKYETIVPPPFAEKRDLVRDWVIAVIENVGAFEDVTHTNVDEVENKSRDGFFPYTLGGFDAVGYGDARSGLGSGTLPAAVKPYTDRETKEHDEEWDKENPDHTVDWIFNQPTEDQLLLFKGVDPHAASREAWREKYHESHDSRFEEGWTYFYKVRALFHDGNSLTKSESGDPEVLLCVAINTDFEYGRDNIPWLSCYGQKTQQSEWLWEKTVKVSDLTSELVDTMIEEASAALRNA